MRLTSRILNRAAIGLLAWAAIAPSGTLAGNEFFVDAARPDDSGDGESWATAKQTIQAAVDLADSSDTVWVTNGIYVLTGEIVLSNAVHVVSVNGPTNTIVDGDGVTRCFRITSGADAVIEGFTITNGLETVDGGGGIYMESGTVRHCRLLNNRAQDPENPTANAGGGGGIWMSGGFVTDCWFEGNVGIRGNDDGGGGARMEGGVISNSWFVANHARQSGGGVSSRHSSSLVVDCTFIGNTADHSRPAAYMFPGRVYRSTITGHADGSSQSGAIGGRNGGIIESSVITNNVMGGIHMRSGSVLNCLIANNGGHGITDNHGSSRLILNNTVVNNGGYGVSLGGNINDYLVANSIFLDNALGDHEGDGRANTHWHNNLGAEITVGATIANTITTNDAHFVSATDFRLQASSPAIDAGMDLSVHGLVMDKRGTPRPTGAGFDIGCYELAQVPRVVNLPAIPGGTEADLAGQLEYDGMLDTTVTIYWGTTDGGTNTAAWANETVVGLRESGDIYAVTVPVDSATRYYFRNAASNDFTTVWADQTATFVSLAGDAETRVWTGWGGDGLASNPANWLGDEAPEPGDSIVLSTLSSSNLTWDAAASHAVGSWTQGGYDGTVTFETVYGAGGFTNFIVTADVTLESGTWTHAENTTVELYRLRVHVGGDLVIVPPALINASEMGFNRRIGEGYVDVSQHGAGYGGSPGRDDVSYTYGSILAPRQIGSGGREGKAGGAIYLTVAGTTHMPIVQAVAGAIRADGETRNGGAGSGGSILLKTGALTGGGSIEAHGGGGGHAHGGGGRIAVILTDPSATFAAWSGTAIARGGNAGGGGQRGAAGTVYQQAGDENEGHGTVIVDNSNLEPSETYADTVTTSLPPPQSFEDDLEVTRWIARNGGWIELTADALIESLDLEDETTRLELAGHTLTVLALTVDGAVFEVGQYDAEDSEHFTDRVGGGKIIVYSPPGTLFLLR